MINQKILGILSIIGIIAYCCFSTFIKDIVRQGAIKTEQKSYSVYAAEIKAIPIRGGVEYNKGTIKTSLSTKKSTGKAIKFNKGSNIGEGRKSKLIKEINNGNKKSLDKSIIHKGFASGSIVQDLVKTAYKLGGLDFVLTLEAENGQWNRNRRSIIIGVNGYYDYGLCQLNKKYHKNFINSKDFKDPYKQLKYCWGVYQDAFKKGRIKTTFYGYNKRLQLRNRFIIK